MRVHRLAALLAALPAAAAFLHPYSAVRRATALSARAPAASTFAWHGHSIAYRTSGPADGRPVLLIHGFGASSRHWRNQYGALASAGCRVVAPDLLGFGASDKPSVTYSLHLWKGLLLDLMAAEAPGRTDWAVGGNSIGGLLSLMVAADSDKGASVSKVVLFNAAGGLTSFRDEELPALAKPLWWFLRNVVFGDVFGPALFGKVANAETVAGILSNVYVNQTAVDDDLVDLCLAPSTDANACDVFLRILRADAGPTPESLLPDIAAPILAIWGESDQITPLAAGNHPGSGFGAVAGPGGFELAVVDAGHCPHDDAVEESNRLMLRFLRE